MLARMEVADLKKQARQQARTYAKTEGEARTEALRNLAETLVDLREHFVTADGHPDWTGRTYDYRRTVSDIWNESGVPRNEIPRARTAVGYHTATVLRERLSDDELDDLGLLPTTPNERAQEQRAASAVLRQAMRTGEIDADDATAALADAARAMDIISASITLLIQSADLNEEHAAMLRRSIRRLRNAEKHTT